MMIAMVVSLLFQTTNYHLQSVNVVKNARLAAKLTGYRIDIKSETAYEEYLENLANPVVEEAEESFF